MCFASVVIEEQNVVYEVVFCIILVFNSGI